LQDDYIDPGMSTADSDSPPLKPQESTDEPPEPLSKLNLLQSSKKPQFNNLVVRR
jgi:hypothetical protein